MVQRAGTNDPGAVLHLVPPDVGMTVEYDVVLSRCDHGLKQIVAMAVSEAQAAPINFQLSPDAVARMAVSVDRCPQPVRIPVTVAEDPMDIKIRESLDRFHGRDIAAVDQGLDSP